MYQKHGIRDLFPMEWRTASRGLAFAPFYGLLRLGSSSRRAAVLDQTRCVRQRIARATMVAVLPRQSIDDPIRRRHATDIATEIDKTGR
jgi:hypothetical protein